MYQIDEQDINPYFKNLSHEELIELIEHFHNKDLSLPKMLEKYNLRKVSNLKFVKFLPPILHSENYCNTCNKYARRTHVRRGELSRPLCIYCNEEMYNDIDPYSKLFKELPSNQLGFKPVITLTITDNEFYEYDIDVQLFLGCLINKGISRDLNYVCGRLLGSQGLVPNIEYLRHLMQILGVGNVHPVGIDLIISDKLGYKYFRPYSKLDLTIEQQLLLWKKINHNELIDIFHKTLQAKGLSTKQHEAIGPILYDLLGMYSAGQIINLIYQAVNCKYDEYLRGKRDKNHTANSVIYTCKSFADYNMREGKKVIVFNRPFSAPQSELSRYLFYDVLKLGEIGFSRVPDVKHLDSYNLN